MNNLNLCEILKGHEGEIFYSSLYGNMTFVEIRKGYAYPLIFTLKSKDYYLTSDGKFNLDNAECLIFPSKDLRDWNKWFEEQKPKTPKTWKEIVESNQNKSYGVVITASGYDIANEPIEKSALALLKIHQLIEVSYGGNILPNKYNGQNTFWVILLEGVTKEFKACPNSRSRHLISFHTRAQAEEFLKYPENIQLLKDYFMI